MSNAIPTSATLAAVDSYEPATGAQPAYLCGTFYCPAMAVTPTASTPATGESSLECEGAEAETFHAEWQRDQERALQREAIRYSIARCYEQAAYALTYAREYPDGSQAKAGCVQRVREPAAPCASFAASFEVQHERHSAPHPP